MSQHSQSSFTLQQSLSESIKESREKVSSLRSDSHQNSTFNSNSNGNSLLQSRMEYQPPQVDKSSLHLWKSLVSEIKNPTAHYFFQAQNEIDELFTLLNQSAFKQFSKVIQSLLHNLDKIKKLIHPNNIHLHDAIVKSLIAFNDSMDPFKVAYLNEFDTITLYESLQLINDLFANLGVAHFLESEDIDDKEEQELVRDVTEDDDGSSSSDFSDDNYDVEEYERETALQLIYKMKKQLYHEEIYLNCKQFQFTTQNIRDFFQDVMKLQAISYSELLCFLNHTGITLKLVSLKKNQEGLKEFIISLQQVINKILNFKGNQLKQFVEENSFEFRYAKFSKAKFFSKKNILQEIQKQVIQSKMTSEVPFSSKKEFRQKILTMSIPINRFETHICYWMRNTNQINKKQKKSSLRDLVIVFYPNQEPLIEMLADLDIKKNGQVNLKQFYQWIRRASIPCSYKEARELFNEYSQIYGQETLEGVIAEKLCNYQDMLDDFYGMKTEKSTTIDKLKNKYSNESMNRQKIAIQRSQIMNLQKQLNEFIKMLDNETQRNKELSEVIKEKESEIEMKNDEMKKMKIQMHQKMLQLDLENNSRLSNAKNDIRNELVMKQKRWEVEKQDLLDMLEQKDRQIEAYRIEIENILGEVATMRTNQTQYQ